MGRPRKTIAEKKLKGTYRKDQDRKPTLITGLGLDTTPPQFLSKMQALECQTLLSVLDERILIEADKTMCALACFFPFFLVGIF
jgi:CRISPR/Cas system CMR-associated protein Cmr5 small subunit